MISYEEAKQLSGEMSESSYCDIMNMTTRDIVRNHEDVKDIHTWENSFVLCTKLYKSIKVNI